MYKKYQIAFVLLIFNFSIALAQDLPKKYQLMVSKLIEDIRLDNKSAVADLISYPLNREYPIPSVKSKQEFIRRYTDIIDVNFKQLIIKSKPAKDWSDMGWRGIMLNDGKLWLNENGKVIAINYQSSVEKVLLDKLILADKKSIHSSISRYSKPIYVLETSKFRIRIDDLGNANFRYSSWSKTKSMSDKPDLIILNGKMDYDGSGGNQNFIFENGEYVYECMIIEIGEENSPPAILTIKKGEKEILSQNAKIITK
jgi:hypothetical protein